PKRHLFAGGGGAAPASVKHLVFNTGYFWALHREAGRQMATRLHAMNERPSQRTTNQASVAAPTADIEVLLVEDDPDDVTIMTRALFSSDFQIGLQVASNGREALDLLRKNGEYADAATPNLVLLDLNMPVMNGREFLEE